MPIHYTYECEGCGHSVTTSEFYEFYFDKEGRRQNFIMSLPRPAEVDEMGIAGLSARMYCSVCDRVHDVIVVEFKEPVKGLAYWCEKGDPEPKNEYWGEDTVRCPDCGNTDLILRPKPKPGELVVLGKTTMSIPCPRCEGGELKGGFRCLVP